MAYSNILHVQRVLAKALTSAPPDEDETGRVDLLLIGETLDTNNVSEDTVYQYITFADNDINADISTLYVVPVLPKANYETTLYTDLDSLHQPYIIVNQPHPFSVGDQILLTDGQREEDHVVESVDGGVITTISDVLYEFQATDTRVLRIGYPPPLTQCSARLAASYIYDKYFAAQSDPNVSEYGKFLRQQARQDINNVLDGIITLHGVQRISRRFYNPTLLNRHALDGFNESVRSPEE
jgi:hypothetical protein